MKIEFYVEILNNFFREFLAFGIHANLANFVCDIQYQG
jgi:hypothetical protein